MDREHGSVESFLEWAAGLGILDSSHSCSNANSCLGHSLIFSQFPEAGGRGLGAARDLRQGELILKVPKSALLTSQSVRLTDQKLSAAFDLHPCLSSTQILTVCLLYEICKGKNSLWYPYLMHLPRSYNVLATFSGFEKQTLQVDDAIWVTEKVVSKLETEWSEASVLMKELKLRPKLLSFKAWLWASATLSSRTLHVPWDAAGCLCPVGDLFNYAAPSDEILDNINPTQSEIRFQRLTDGGFEEDVDAYCFYARRNYKQGEQVLLCYGTYTNLELLEHYGFILDDNPNDKVFIPLEPSVYMSISWPRESLYIHHNGEPSFALMSALRLWITSVSQRKSVSHLVYSGLKISVENETLVLKWIWNRCESLLKGLPTSINEDHSVLFHIDHHLLGLKSPAEKPEEVNASGHELCVFLKTSGRTKRSVDRWRLAVQWRLRYKTILADCVRYCAEKIKSLSLGTGPRIQTQ